MTHHTLTHTQLTPHTAHHFDLRLRLSFFGTIKVSYTSHAHITHTYTHDTSHARTHTTQKRTTYHTRRAHTTHTQTHNTHTCARSSLRNIRFNSTNARAKDTRTNPTLNLPPCETTKNSHTKMTNRVVGEKRMGELHVQSPQKHERWLGAVTAAASVPFVAHNRTIQNFGQMPPQLVLTPGARPQVKHRYLRHIYCFRLQVGVAKGINKSLTPKIDLLCAGNEQTEIRENPNEPCRQTLSWGTRLRGQSEFGRACYRQGCRCCPLSASLLLPR